MVKFEDLQKKGIFSVNAWEILPTFSPRKEFDAFSFGACIADRSFSFIKDSDNTCKELVTGVQFVCEDQIMINDEYGLCFFASYVNEKKVKNHAEAKYTKSYFEVAKMLNNQNKQKVLKK